MNPWMSLLLEAGMAVLMTALIVYCVKLNRRLSLLRSQDAEIKELIAGFREASERAELSVQRLKAAGLAAERSLRGAMEDAAAMRTELAGLASAAPTRPPPGATPGKPTAEDALTGASSAVDQAVRAKRDMLMAAASPSRERMPAAPAPVRPRTREEAEESVIQAIRSARGEA
jgi:hypothetical protein